MPVSDLFERVRALYPDRPLRTLWRSAGYKLRPPRPVAFVPQIDSRVRARLAEGCDRPEQVAELLCELRPGPIPTVVLGGFVPDATEAVYILRGMFLRHGSVYYFNYPHDGFSAPLLFAQLEDLLEELSVRYGTPPIVMGISFGCGLLLEWLRRARRRDRPARLRGIVLVSPVTCTADVLERGIDKPGTMLGRALAPFLAASGGAPEEAQVDRSRKLLLRMFEAGVQGRNAARVLLTRGELLLLRHRVMRTVGAITARGATERIRAFAAMEPPTGWFTLATAPLCEAPVLVLFAEKESSVLSKSAPSARLQEVAGELFPSAQVRVVSARVGGPVQHASLVFHAFHFSPPLSRFYRRLRKHVALEQGGLAVRWGRAGMRRMGVV